MINRVVWLTLGSFLLPIVSCGCHLGGVCDSWCHVFIPEKMYVAHRVMWLSLRWHM